MQKSSKHQEYKLLPLLHSNSFAEEQSVHDQFTYLIMFAEFENL